MILFELTNSEQNPVYQELAVSNGNRQYDFLRSIVHAAVAIQRPFLSAHIIKALRFKESQTMALETERGLSIMRTQ